MLQGILIVFHVLSLIFCWLAIRTTIHYLSKHRIVPQHRYMLFGFFHTRYMAVIYGAAILTMAIYSFTMAFYYF